MIGGGTMKRLIPLLLLLLLLTGCHMEKEYLSVRPHVEQQQWETESGDPEAPPVVSNRLELRGAILTFIENWQEQGRILIRDYEGELEQNLEEAMDYATRQHPTGAYAVDYADSELLEEDGQLSVQISIVFRRSPGEIHSIVLVDDNEAAVGKIREALDNFNNALTLRIRHYSDEDMEERITELCMENPRTIPCIPDCSVKLYPDTGDHRILELHFTYPESRDSMRSKLQEIQTLFGSAQKRVEMEQTPYEKAGLLYRYLVRRKGTLTDTQPPLPVYSLLADGIAHDLSLAMFYDELCENTGVSCEIITGTKGGRTYYWNFLTIEEENFHLDLRRGMEQGQWNMTALYDEDLLAEGYEWDMTSASAPKPVEETPPTESEGTDSEPTVTVTTEPTPTEAEPPTESTPQTETTEPITETDPSTDPSEPTAQEESMISGPFGNG